MRRGLTAILFVLVLVALDGVFDGYRYTRAIYSNVLEFGRLVTRTASGF